ncbi:hypothetical protein QT386_01315 [Solimonas sp. SE-A11]|nr:hypothetical protein [Solimonas sp. SE-A11]
MSRPCRLLLLLAALLGATAAPAQWADPRTAPAGSMTQAWDPGTAPPGPPPAERSSESVTAGFFRQFPILWPTFVEAMKETPELRKGGSITVAFTIEADGRVTDPKLVASDFNRPELESQILRQLRLIRFDPGNFAPKPVASFQIPLHPAPNPTKPAVPSRSLDEVQLGFESQKAAFLKLYEDARAQWPVLSEGGKIIVRLEVAPDGRMTGSSLVSSTFRHPEFESRILAQVQSMRLEAKDIPAFVYPNYPIVLHPPT